MTVQHWGCLLATTYCVTVIVVLILVVAGGTFQRLREQAANYEIMGKAASPRLCSAISYTTNCSKRAARSFETEPSGSSSVEKTAKKEAVRSWWGGVAEATTAQAKERIRGIIGGCRARAF